MSHPNDKYFVTQRELFERVRALVLAHQIHLSDKVWGVPRGGVPIAGMVAGIAGCRVALSPDDATIIVDDIIDSGKTQKRYFLSYPDKRFIAPFNKLMAMDAGKWLVMPYEWAEGKDESATDIVTRLFEYIGEDPEREGLKETPARFLKAWEEWAKGYKTDPAALLKTFKDGADRVNEMVVVHNIPVISKCEHHLADIIGTAHVGYIPNGKIVGISKFARVVDAFARRLQVQERLTNQIADLIHEVLSPIGVGVIIRAKHHCMSTRGVKVHGSVTTTSAMRGAMLTKPEARAEFMQLCRDAEQWRE